MHKSSAIIFFGAKTLIFTPVFLFFIPTWCENKTTIRINKILFLALGVFNGKY